MIPTFADPSFESPAADNFGTYNPSGTSWTYSGAGPGSTGGFPQASSDGSGVAALGSGFLYSGIVYNGSDASQVGFLQGVSTISQALLGFSAGTYAISFEYAPRWANSQYVSLTVSVDGTVVDTLSIPYSDSPVTFQSHTTPSFSLAAGSHTISFGTVDTGDVHNTVLLDLVQLVILSIDQPATTFARPLGFIPRRPAGQPVRQRMFGGNR